jgi:hypothetical protein
MADNSEDLERKVNDLWVVVYIIMGILIYFFFKTA